MIEIASDRLTAAINPLGAELSHLRDADGRELMTDADPAFWTGRAPLLFPIVGRLMNDRYRLDGKEYSLPKHGFARQQMFEIAEQAADRVTFRLNDNEETRAHYPFAFTLDVTFTLHGATLAIEAMLINISDRDMPASFGFHPAFAWPLPYGGAKTDHRITFEKDEPGDLYRIVPEGWLDAQPVPSPLDGRVLHLNDALFEHDALIWQRLNSRSVRYGAGEGHALEVAFPDTETLGIWTKPGAHFVCIEPWHGLADPDGFAGEIWAKPGILRLPPGEVQKFSMQVTLRD